MKINLFRLRWFYWTLYGILGFVSFAYATTHETRTCNERAGYFNNPVAACTIGDLVKALASIVVQIAIPIVVVFLIYAGFLFVSARGNEKQLTTAKQTFYWTIIGATVVVGAYALASAIVHFAQSLGGGGSGS